MKNLIDEKINCPYCGSPEWRRDDEIGWIRWECNSWTYLRDGKPASQHPDCKIKPIIKD